MPRPTGAPYDVASTDLADAIAEAVDDLTPEGWKAVVVLYCPEDGAIVVRSSMNQTATHMALADLLHQITH